ncbi:rRNA-processing protein cgr1 [Ceratocystis pirilliformis]|uniref:rRNA-processing protein cgr1 n=1 Tax=Ceratocystis pirilliformis TaxID=259994 RepID=A0ABR3ZKM5_9PEZI
MHIWSVTDPFLPKLRCQLGEGPYYEPATDSVRFVDIKGNCLHTVYLGNKTLTTLPLATRVTVTADIAGVDPVQTILVGAKHGIAKLHRKTGELEYLAPLTEQQNERLRPNDGAVGPDGRFWLGYMTDFGQGDFRPEGGLVTYAQGQRERHLPSLPIKIPNTIGWSPDTSTMYFTHSSARQVFAFNYNVAQHSYSSQRIFYTHGGTGEPDGFRIDTEGNMWHAVYGEGKVLKIAPNGEVVGEVCLPTLNVTCVQFVGSKLFITTAADEDSGDEKSIEFGGAVFMVEVGAQGLNPFEYRL